MNEPVIHRRGAQLAARKIQAADSNYFAFTVDPHSDRTDFVQVIEIFEVGGATPPNRHVVADEVFYVLHGEGVASCNDQSLTVRKGDSFLVRAGHEHRVVNTGRERLYCLTTMVPDEDFAALIRGGIAWELDASDRAVLGG